MVTKKRQGRLAAYYLLLLIPCLVGSEATSGYMFHRLPAPVRDPTGGNRTFPLVLLDQDFTDGAGECCYYCYTYSKCYVAGYQKDDSTCIMYGTRFQNTSDDWDNRGQILYLINGKCYHFFPCTK